MVTQWVALPPNSCIVPGWIPQLGLLCVWISCACSPLITWVSSTFSDFLRIPKTLPLGGLVLGLNECQDCVCMVHCDGGVSFSMYSCLMLSVVSESEIVHKQPVFTVNPIRFNCISTRSGTQSVINPSGLLLNICYNCAAIKRQTSGVNG